MQTATKYIGGHSDTLGGVLTGTHAMMKKIFDLDYLAIGSGIQPFNAWLLLRGLRTLPARLERIYKTTAEVLQFLEAHPRINKILFPFHASFPQRELALSQMKAAGGLLTITLKDGTMESITRFCEALQHIRMAVSWGGHESLVIPKCAGIEPGHFKPAKEEHQHIRLYTGLEDAHFLIADLEQALS